MGVWGGSWSHSSLGGVPLGDLKNPHNHRQNVFEGFYAAIDLTTLKGLKALEDLMALKDFLEWKALKD